MKKILAIVIAVLVGFTVLVGYFFQSFLSPILRVIFDWFVLILGVAGLIGIGTLIWLHFAKLMTNQKVLFTAHCLLQSFC